MRRICRKRLMFSVQALVKEYEIKFSAVCSGVAKDVVQDEYAEAIVG